MVKQDRARGTRLLRAAAEFVIIVLGVVVGLAADGWLEEQRERAAEADYVARLVLDLEADTLGFGQAQRAFEGKREALTQLAQLDPDTNTINPEDLARLLATAASWSWHQAPANSTTFEEMRSSGRLGLVQDADMRSALSMYYAISADMDHSIDARRTAMGPLSYQLVRRPAPGASDGLSPLVRDRQVAGLTATERSRLNNSVLLDDIVRAATAELNFSYFAAEIFGALRERAGVLAERLEQYSGS